MDEQLDKTTFAAFGTRKLKTECVLLKRLLIESQELFKGLIRVKDVMGRHEKQIKGKVGALEGKRSYQTYCLRSGGESEEAFPRA